MAAVASRMPDLTPPPSSPHLTLNTSVTGTPTAVPNKHLPYCSPGPEPVHGLISPPASPPNADSPLENTSLLYPPISYPRLAPGSSIFTITAAALAKAVNHVATQPLADPNIVFPWLHGLHPENHFQLNFFNVRKRATRQVPRHLRGLTIVQVGGDLNNSRIKGAVAPSELLIPAAVSKSSRRRDSQQYEPGSNFIDSDPKVGFNVRNFHVQACKMATVSDIVVYGDDFTPRSDVEEVAVLISKAQKAWSQRPDMVGRAEGKFNTFILIDSFSCLLENHPDVVAIDAKGTLNPAVMDFSRQERIEMATLSATSEISNNVFLGPSPDPSVPVDALPTSMKGLKFDVMLEASDFAAMPDIQAFQNVEQRLATKRNKIQHLPFPASGSLAPSTGSCSPRSIITSSDAPALDGLLQACRWIHQLANDSSSTSSRRFLLHCADGYTETSLLALAYLMFSLQIPASQAWIHLHTTLNRNFFAYPADKLLLERFQLKLAKEVPGYGRRPESLLTNQPIWMANMDGSLPSRILPYLYLGNLTHANNPDLLATLGIHRVLSVGEPIAWSSASLKDLASSGGAAATAAASHEWKDDDLLYIDKVQDNGTDPLTGEFERCLRFIEEGRKLGIATLVHCRVGVSRSATICIAEVMREKEFNFARA